MQERRLAAVFAVDSRKKSKTSTGYVIAARLVLTAAHAAGPADKAEVQLIDQASSVPCTVLWNGRSDDLDAALLEVDPSDWPPDAPTEPVRFGRLVTLQPNNPAETLGFPAAQRGADGELETAHVYGHINPGDMLLSGRWVLSVSGTSPEDLGSSPWRGISGAALFADKLLCGVVVVDAPHWRHGKLHAVQMHRLLRNKEFAALLRERLGYSPIAEAAELQSLAESATLPRRPRSLPELLRPQTETVRFVGRDEQLAEFRAWCQGDGITARLLVGPGGQGKTRLARELGRLLAAEGWVVAQLKDDARVEDYRILGKVSERLLLIMDYADTRPGSVAEVMRVLEENSDKTAVRILLIARSAGEWWEQLPASASAYVSLLSGAAVIRLDALADTLPARLDAYRMAASDLAAGLRRLADYASTDWEEIARGLPAPELSDPRLASPLTLQLRVLTDLLAAQPGVEVHDSGEPVEALFLQHELRYWTRTATRRPLLADLGPDELGDAVAAATLTRGATRERAIELLGSVPGLIGLEQRTRAALAGWLSDLYPAGGGSYWGALEPDRLGEYLVSARIQHQSGFLPAFLTVLSTEEAVRALTVLARAAAQPVCPCPDLLSQVAALIAAHPEGLAVPAALVATQSENPEFLVEALSKLATRSDLPADLLDRLSMAFPAQTASLAQPAVNISRSLIHADRRAVRRSIFATSVVRSAAEADLARAYHNYSHRLMGLGRWDGAIRPAKGAIRLYRRLAKRDPDRYRPLLAGSLDNLATALSSTGQARQALRASQRARQVHRLLAADGSDAHLAALARSLSNVSGIFADLDAYQAGLNTSTEAVVIMSRLAEQNPAVYLPELAAALHNQATHYAEASWFDDAEAASARVVAIRRRLAVQRPDANLPGLAHSLHNLALDQADTDKLDAALLSVDESISVYLRLVLDRGRSYLPHLANALNTKAVLLVEGKDADFNAAVLAGARSVRFYLELARENPAEFRPELAMALSNHKWALTGAGRRNAGQWSAMLTQAQELVKRDDLERARRDTDRTLREDEEIKRLAVEITTLEKIDEDELWSAADQILGRFGMTLGLGQKEGDRPAAGWRDRLRAARLESWRTLRGLFSVRGWQALADGFRKKGKGGMHTAEDPRETWDYSYKELVEMLTRLRRAVADVAVKRMRTELQMGAMKKSRAPDRDDQIAQLERDHEVQSENEEKLTAISQQLDTRVSGFRLQKEVLKATYTAAEAKSRIVRAFSAIADEHEQLGLKTQRAQDRTTYMQVRLDSDRQAAATVPADNAPPPSQQEMRTAEEGLSADIAAELERLKHEIGDDTQPGTPKTSPAT